jgi:hypothetical protein
MARSLSTRSRYSVIAARNDSLFHWNALKSELLSPSGGDEPRSFERGGGMPAADGAGATLFCVWNDGFGLSFPVSDSGAARSRAVASNAENARVLPALIIFKFTISLFAAAIKTFVLGPISRTTLIPDTSKTLEKLSAK